MHAHIVRVFEFHEDQGAAFYSMQFVDGADLGVLTRSSLADLLPPVGLVAEALRYAHGKGIVHRDIKASNVLLDFNGAPYLSDLHRVEELWWIPDSGQSGGHSRRGCAACGRHIRAGHTCLRADFGRTSTGHY
jgi:serine/threonine-protein kinase